jgi:hypothetical protein
MPCSSVCPEAIGPDGFCDLHRPPDTAWWPRGPMPARERCAGEALGRFIRWMRYGGATFDALEVAAGPDAERHVRMRQPVAAGAPILAVPRRLVLTDDHVQASPVGQALEEAGVTLQSPHSPLAAFLLAGQLDERAVHHALAAACDEALARFAPEPPAEAEELRARLCAIVRRGEQDVLRGLAPQIDPPRRTR